MLIEPYLEALAERAGSDLLLQPGTPPMIRVEGRLVALEHPDLTPEFTRKVVTELVTPEMLRSLDAARQLDFAIHWRDGQIR